jgi:hypothetical protein
MFHQLQELGSCIELWEYVARMHKICYTCKVRLEAFIYPITFVVIYYLYLAAKVYAPTCSFHRICLCLQAISLLELKKKRHVHKLYLDA